MEENAHVWLRSPKSEWGWLPAKIRRKALVPKKQQKNARREAYKERTASMGAYARSKMTNQPSFMTSVQNIGGDKNPLVKKLEDSRRTELQTLMRDRTLPKDEKKAKMDAVKEKYNRLVAEVEADAANGSTGGDGGPDAAPQEPEEEMIIELTIVDDFTGIEDNGNFYSGMESFTETVYIDPAAQRKEHPDIKLRNMANSGSPSNIESHGSGRNLVEKDNSKSTSHIKSDGVAGGVDDLIGLTHLHEPAILHALRLRYDADIIYTSTGPILLAINPFKRMPGIYAKELMHLYREQGEEAAHGSSSAATVAASPKFLANGAAKKSPLSKKASTRTWASKDGRPKSDDGQPIPPIFLHRSTGKLPPHVYQAADDAYRAMMRGIGMKSIMKGGGRGLSSPRGRGGRPGQDVKPSEDEMPTNQSILVSGESGAGKTVTTKIVLNYFAMLSQKIQERALTDSTNTPAKNNGRRSSKSSVILDDTSIESKVLQSNPILEAFGNARTIRNDNSSRFGKYINIAFTERGQLSRASIDTYLLEKVRLIHQTNGERNFHVFYQFLEAARDDERRDLLLNGYTVHDFHLTNQSDTYDRRDNVDDVDMHVEMVDAMNIMNFGADTTKNLMRLVVAVLFAGNMTFSNMRTAQYGDTAVLDETEASLAVAELLGVSFDNLAASLTSKVIFARGDMIHKGLDQGQAEKANEALIKSIYGAAFDLIAELINASINKGTGRIPSSGSPPKSARRQGSSAGVDEPLNIVPPGGASIGVLDIFGFETFEVNAFEQLCINYTNETLQQQFNRFVFKLEQQEYEREGILWKFIPFPDNQDVLDLIDKPPTGILQILDEQCIVDWGTDKKFSLSLYSTCEQASNRFHVSPAQRVRNKFAVEHYAGFVEYSTENWLEKNKDQLPAASAELLESSDFELIGRLKKYVRYEGAKIAMKSLGRQFSDSLKVLRSRINETMPHYVRCLKPNDALLPNNFDPKNIVEQLRYCGVLEAVRVSRAGYPTRYPHDIFMTRYYMICPNRDVDEDNLSPYHHEVSSNLTNEQKQLKRTVSRVATEIWKVESVLKKGRTSSGDAAQPKDNRHALAQPKTIEEFMRLDFSSRCAVAGLQLGKTKVFLRREAFQLMESIRNERFGKNVTNIAKNWRRFAAMKYLRDAKRAAVLIQCVIRMGLAAGKTSQLMKEFRIYLKKKNASIKIQKMYRNHYCKYFKEGAELRQRKAALVTIQGALRGRLARKRVFSLVQSIVRFQSKIRARKQRREYLSQIAAVAKMQSLARVVIACKVVEELRRQRAALRIQSMVRMMWVYNDFRRHVDAASLIKRAYREHLYQERRLYGTFLNNYYMLGDTGDNKYVEEAKVLKRRTKLLTRHRQKIVNAKKLEFNTLVDKLTLELWEPGKFESFAKPRVGFASVDGVAAIRQELSGSGCVPLEPSVGRSLPQAAPAPVSEPPSKSTKKKKFGFSMSRKKSTVTESSEDPKTRAKVTSSHKSSLNGSSKPRKGVRPAPAPLPSFTPIPQTKDEFMKRSPASRRALVGMQVADGTLFLRPETYQLLEKMRNSIVGGSSAKIQALARGKLTRCHLKKERVAVVKVQSFVRMYLEKRHLLPKKREYAATKIQSVFRMSVTRKSVWSTYWSTQNRDLFGFIKEDNWYMVEKMLHKNPLLVEEADPDSGELPLHKIVERASAWTLLIDMILTLYPKAIVHKDYAGELPIHHAARTDNLTALEIIYESYKNGAKDADGLGRLPIHVAAEHGSIEAIKFLTMNVPECAHTTTAGGGSLPVHIACKNYSSVGVITCLLRTSNKFGLVNRTDENGELPLHLLLRCGEEVDVVAVRTLLTCNLKTIGKRDKNGDIPLHIALKNKCKPAVIEALLSHFPGSSVVMDGQGHSPLHLALTNSAEDETNVSLIKYAPQMVTLKDDRTGLLPIEIATQNELSLFIVYRLLKQDMPIDLKERVQVRLIPHYFSWNHILLDVEDRYYQVVSKILQQCTQPQVLALAHVEDSEGKIALASATPICRHEIRVMLRLFNTLELVKQRPAYTNGASDTEIFYALRYEPPPEQSDLFSTDYEQKDGEGDFTEDWDDDMSHDSNADGPTGVTSDDASLSVAEKLNLIRNEQGQHVIAKITPRSDIVERELRVRKDYNLSRHYVPSVISVHHTVHHGAYQNASAEAAYCITMEGADATIEHLMLDYRRAGRAFPCNELKRIGMVLLHLHENGLVHSDFGPHSVGKFGPLFKLLGVGGCVPIGEETDPKHGIYHPPEAITVETIEVDGAERKTARVVPVKASPAVDLWAFGHMIYESVAGTPLSAYSHRGKRVKSSNLAKIARWDDHSLERSLRFIDADDSLARDVISKLLHPDPEQRFRSIRDAIADPFFNTDAGDRKIRQVKGKAKS